MLDFDYKIFKYLVHQGKKWLSFQFDNTSETIKTYEL